MESLTGRLIVAAPTLLDPNFARTVVLVASHDEEGAMGIVLNRRSDALVDDAVPDLARLAAGEPVHIGGPVAPESVLLLCDFADPGLAGLLVCGSIGLPAPDAELDEIWAGSRRVRVCAGYAGWGPGQLDGELEREDWIVAAAEPDDVFAEDPDALWGAVLERKGGRYALVARMPLDPSLN